MRKIPVITLAIALACGSALAATHHETDTHPADGSVTLHKMGAEIRSAWHRLGEATRHALRRADASMHRDRDNRHAALENNR